MAKVEIDDPELYMTKRTDKQGRIYIGKQYVDQEIEFVVVSSADSDDGEASIPDDVAEAEPDA